MLSSGRARPKSPAAVLDCPSLREYEGEAGSGDYHVAIDCRAFLPTHHRLYNHNFLHWESCVHLNTRSWLKCWLEGLTSSERVDFLSWGFLGPSSSWVVGHRTPTLQFGWGPLEGEVLQPAKRD